ncbi:MAG: Kelch repeat-containing protein [Gemmatimonadales bacterium]
MRTAQGYHAAAVVNGVLYAVGGYDSAALTGVEAYAPGTNTWTAKAPLPRADAPRPRVFPFGY